MSATSKVIDAARRVIAGKIIHRDPFWLWLLAVSVPFFFSALLIYVYR